MLYPLPGSGHIILKTPLINPSPERTSRIYKIGVLDINPADQTLIDNLRSRGHRVNIYKRSIASPVMVYIDQSTGISYAASQYANSGGKYCGALNLPE
jgi:hypothetical protein